MDDELSILLGMGVFRWGGYEVFQGLRLMLLI